MKGKTRISIMVALAITVLTVSLTASIIFVHAQPQHGVVSITFDVVTQDMYDYAWPLLKAKGMHATFYVPTDEIGTSGRMSPSELQTLQSNGNEIASHSKTHPDFVYISDAQIQQECSVSKQVLQSYGLTINNFAYPYGDRNDHTDSIVSQYYRSARSAYDTGSLAYVMPFPTSQFRLMAVAGGIQTSFDELKGFVDRAMGLWNPPGWVIIVFHGVVPSPGDWQTSTHVFSQFLDYLVSNSVTVLTVNQALDMGSRGVAVTNVVPSTVVAVAGTVINITVTVKNKGGVTETFSVTTYYDNNTIAAQTVTNLAPGATGTLTFNWNTNAVPLGNHTIKAEASTVPSETDTADNIYVDGTVEIVKPPTANFTYDPSNPITNEPVLFNASSSTPNEGTITNCKWTFGDGSTTSTSNLAATHVYTTRGTDNVTLTVTNSENLNASTWNSITINAPVQTEISILTHSSSNLVGFKVEINGTLTDSEGKGISGATILVSYTLPTVSEWVPFISATTDSQGKYYSQWIPPSTGDFTLKAEWAGTQTIAGASQNTTLNIIPYQDEYIFSVASNSTISLLTFNSTSQELEFNATGPPSTTGSTRVTIAKALVDNASQLKVFLDGTPLAYSASAVGDSWVVSFTYTHSTHRILLALYPYRLRGDVNNDGRVNILDLSIVAAAYGSKPTDARWNSAADLDNDGIVDIVDISIVAREYGTTV